MTDQPELQPFRRTTYAIWEITLACRMACAHCGSRAGTAREDELSTEEALDLVRQLDEAGIREVSLIGGEAVLRPDWETIARAIADRGMVCSMITSGLGVTPTLARRIVRSGICAVSVSIDGLETTHDRVRGVPGAFRAALRALGHLRDAGLQIAVNTQIHRASMPELAGLYERLRPLGIYAWQLQLTLPMGNAADRPESLLQPYDLLELFPQVAAIAEQCRADGIQLACGNNLGYYGPYEELLRSRPGEPTYWQGCQAGISVLGIQADGRIKGCSSLPTEAYTGGNVRTQSLREIVTASEALGFNRIVYEAPDRATEHLWDFCGTCYYGEVCRAGCTWTSHILFGRRGNNPYCHHRALELQAQGLRERLEPEQAPPGRPFDHGLFRLIREPLTTG